jgi:hypothetical protein
MQPQNKIRAVFSSEKTANERAAAFTRTSF